jgi:hypothetical protein
MRNKIETKIRRKISKAVKTKKRADLPFAEMLSAQALPSARRFFQRLARHLKAQKICADALFLYAQLN